jgi:hypothetical protein
MKKQFPSLSTGRTLDLNSKFQFHQSVKFPLICRISTYTKHFLQTLTTYDKKENYTQVSPTKAEIFNAKFQQNHHYFDDVERKSGRHRKRTHNADGTEKINSAQNPEKCFIFFVAFRESKNETHSI